MAVNFDNNDETSNIYKSSGGFIPANPASIWYGVPKEFFEKIAPDTYNKEDAGAYALQSFVTDSGQEINASFALNNYGTAEAPSQTITETQGVIVDAFGNVDSSDAVTTTTTKKLVSLDDAGTGFNINPNIEPIFTCTSKGWGELYVGFGGSQSYLGVAGADIENLSEAFGSDISPEANPTTVAVRRTLANAIMSMYASEEFFLYMLSKGYVYKGIDTHTNEPPINWIENARSYTKATFNIQSYPQDSRIGDPDRAILAPENHPSYGTKYDPSSPETTTIQKEYYDNGFANPSVGNALYDPLNASADKPTFVTEWYALWEKDSSISFQSEEFGQASLEAPVYKGQVKIHADLFIEKYLLPQELVELDIGKAWNIYLDIINGLPAFNKDTGQTEGSPPLINIPGTAGTKLLGNFADTAQSIPEDGTPIVDIFTLAKTDAIAKNMITDLVQIEEEQPFEIGTIFPGSTHYVNKLATDKIKNGNFEERQYYSKYLKEKEITIMRLPKESTSDQYIVTTIKAGTTIKVVNEYLTFGKGKYHKVQITDPDSQLYNSKGPLFIRSCLLNKLPNELPSLERVYNDYEKEKKPTEWYEFKDETIFFDKYYKAYSIVVEPTNPSTGEKVTSLGGTSGDESCATKIEDLEPVAIRHGIEALMRCYGKKPFFDNDEEYVQTLDYLTSGVFQCAYSKAKQGNLPNWYLDTRPDSKLKMIVRIPAKYFDAFKDKYNPFGLGTSSGVGQEETNKKFEIDFDGRVATTSPQKSIHFITCNLSHKIKEAVKVLHALKEQISKFNGTIEFLDLDQEIQRLELFPLSLEKFVEENGLKFDKFAEDEVEIGIIPNDFSVMYVEYSKAGFPQRLLKCFSKFVISSPIKFPRTIGYLFYLDDIISMGKAGTSKNNTWQRLANEYTFPQPVIKSASPTPMGEIIGEKTIDNIAEKLDKLDVLSSRSKLSQDEQISDPELKLQLASARSKQSDFSGDAFVAALPRIIELVCSLPRNESGLQDLFSMVFDKIDIPKLASLSSSSLMKNMSFPDIQGSFALASLDSPDFGEMNLEKLFGSLPSSIQGQIEMAEGFLKGDLDIGDLKGLPDFQLEQLLGYFDNINLQIPQNGKECTDKTQIENAKYSTMPVDDAKCLSENNPEKYPSEKNTLTKCSSQRTDLIKMLVPQDDLLKGIKATSPDIFDSISSLGSIPDLDIPSPGSLSLNMPAIKMPKPPTLPSFSLQKIEDTMKGIAQELNDGLNMTIADIIIELSCDLLQMVFDEIFSTSTDIGMNGVDGTPIEFGGQDINELIQTGADKLFADIGVSDIETNDGTPREVMAKVSEVITPLEAIDLLQGIARNKTIEAIETKMKDVNPRMFATINTNSSTKELFKRLGGLADPDLLENTRTAMTEILPNVTGLLCEAEKVMYGGQGVTPSQMARIESLEGKLDPECIDTQLNSQDELRREKLAQLLSLAAGTNVFDGKIANPIDNCGKNAKSAPNTSIPASGFINKNHPTVDYLNDKVIKAIFDPIKMNFSEEANSIINIYSEENFRNPFEFEDQYKLLESQLDINGMKDDFQDGLLGNLDLESGAQAKFEQIATPLKRLDVKVAPKMKKLFSTKTAYVYSQPTSLLETNMGLKLIPTATGSVKSGKMKELETVQRELDSLRKTKTTLDGKLDFIQKNPSSPFGIDLDKVQNELNDIDDKINIAENHVKMANEKFQNLKDNLDAGVLPGADPLVQEYPFYHYSNKYPINQARNVFTLKDTWTFDLPIDTAKGIINVDERTTGGDLTIEVEKEIPSTLQNFASVMGSQDVSQNNDMCEEDKIMEDLESAVSDAVSSGALSATLALVGGASESISGADRESESTSEQSQAIIQGLQGITPSSVLVKGEKELDPELLELTEDFTYFDNYTERDQVFANLFKEKWEINGQTTVDFDSVSGQKFFDFFRERRPLYFSALVNIFGGQLAQSKLFNVENFANLEFGESMQIQQNICDNLLALEDLKEAAKKQYDNTCDDNQSSSKPGAIEEANIANLIKASIRLILIQLVSESIFLFSMYSFEKSITDEALVQFILELTIHDLQKQGQEYYQETLNYNKKYLQKRQENGEKLVDPFSDSNDSDPLLESEGKIAYLQYTIKEELKKVAPLIDKKINPAFASPHDIFLSTIIPELDVAYHKDQNRYQRTITTNTEAEEDFESLQTTAELKGQFKFLNPQDPLFKNSGGFILEKYIRIEDSDLIIEGNEFLNEAEKVFGEEWFNRVGGRDNVEVLDATVAEKISFDDESPSPESFSFTSGAVNIDALVQKLTSILDGSKEDLANVDITKFIKTFKYGMRLVYIPSGPADKIVVSSEVNVSELANESFPGGKLNFLFEDDTIQDIKDNRDINIFNLVLKTANFDSVYEDSITTSQPTATKESIINNIARKEKLYKTTEMVGTVVDDGESESTLLLESSELELFPVPLIEVENDLNVLNAISGTSGGKVSLESLLIALKSPTVTELAFTALKKKLANSKKYKLLFDYDIPLQRIPTLLFVHSVISSTKNYPEIHSSYDQTKELIRTNFFNMIPGDPWWSKQDKEIDKAGGNAGMMADANNSMTAGGPSGSKIAAKIAAKAAIILVKAFAKQTDPHYKLMSILDNFGLTIDGMTWLSVPALYPVNFPLPFPPWVGWGPPMTPTGMIAYSLPLLPGEVKKKKKKKEEEGKLDDSSCNDK